MISQIKIQNYRGISSPVKYWTRPSNTSASYGQCSGRSRSRKRTLVRHIQGLVNVLFKYHHPLSQNLMTIQYVWIFIETNIGYWNHYPK